MNNRSNVVLSLCMDFSAGGSDVMPLTNAEFHKLISTIEKYNGVCETGQIDMFQQSGNLDFEFLPEVNRGFLESELGLESELASKIFALCKRSAAVPFELDRLESTAKVVTIFDEDYPQRLKDKLGTLPNSMREPALLYYCGDLSLQKISYVGFVGARDCDETDREWTVDAVNRISDKAEKTNDIFGIVSGGAEGIDRISEDAALDLNMPVIEFSKSMRTTLSIPAVIDAVQSQNMLLLSEINPLRRLSKHEATAHFMNRNKYIYAMSEYTVVVKSAQGSKSGTWNGAVEAMERELCKVCVRDAKYDGNIDLIAKGATKITL